MGAAQARQLCPHAIVVDPRMSAYAEASRAVFAVFDDTTPLVEGLSIDEAFLDVGGLRRVSGAPADIAAQLRHAVWDRVGLRITVGVARTKFLAKVASGVAKPDGLLVVAPDAEAAFLHPLAVERLWGVGQKTAQKLRDLGITTVGEVAHLTEASLVSMLGPAAGRKLHALAHRLRSARRVGRTVVLRLRFGDYSRVTRSRTIPQSTAETQPIRDAARELLTAARPVIRERGLTLIGVAVTNLDDDDAVQLALPLERASGEALDRALDEVRDRFGSAMVSRAARLGRDRGWSMPLLPEGQPSSQPS